METINGFTVIASEPGNTRNDYRRILAVRPHEHTASGFEYVIAYAAHGPVTSWSSGTYVTDLSTAVAYFENH